MKYFSNQNLSILLLTLLVFTSLNFGQNKKAPPCSSKEARQFDFWMGDWDIHWTTVKGETAYGKNIVKSILGGCVINENFSTKAPKPFLGKSYSVYNSVNKIWQQTWVDNTGGYMVFTGGLKEGKMILSREIISKTGNKIIQRMVFYNISKNKLDWDWESSKDNGKTWKLNWRLHYTRHKKL